MEKGRERMKLGFGRIKDTLKGVTAESTSEGKKEHVEEKRQVDKKKSRR